MRTHLLPISYNTVCVTQMSYFYLHPVLESLVLRPEDMFLKFSLDTTSGMNESDSPNQIKNVPVLRACVGFSKINSSAENESLNAKITTDPCGKSDFHRFTESYLLEIERSE